ncbi:hypothetical protein C8A03DRAFT_37904 [Achaetomium macrosporum]|uniref:Methyltransferase n=1 Tax=Achaetomium macrosporum TaxID=79813 RepID=A0AAN7C3I1_9PEZI|nr:hypothetical protein C8A03DRAFT_37904 [Achaetomium macrosporum]
MTTTVLTETQKTNGQVAEKDPRMTDEFQTHLVGSGPQQDVSAYIFYSKVSAEGVKPTEKDLPFLKGEFTDARRVVIHDARGQGKNLDENGFEYIAHPKPEADYSDANSVRQVYYPAMMQLIKQKLGASEVLIFDHRVRQSSFSTKYGTEYSSYTGPVIRPHVDFAPVHAPNFLRRIRPANHGDYAGRRWQVINFWRPLRCIDRDPLAVADAPTVPEDTDELLHLAYAGTPRQTETFLTLGGKEGAHQWYYYPSQQPDEVLAFKIYDSHPPRDNARCVPHTSFRGLDVPEGTPPRHSIEIRCFIAYD